MNAIEQAIVDRRTRITELTAEVEALELALSITRGGAGPVKPPQLRDGRRPVRAEKPGKRAKRAPCPHGEASRNQCRECRREYQNAWYAAKLKKSGKAPKTKADEPDPAPTAAVPKVATAVSQVAAANAAKWQGQCQMLDSGTGKRCSLQGGHAMPHSASGRTFSAAAAINIAAMGGSVTRELDQQALRGGTGA